MANYHELVDGKDDSQCPFGCIWDLFPVEDVFLRSQKSFGSKEELLKCVEFKFWAVFRNLLEFFIEVDWTAPHSEIAVSLGALKLGMSHLQLRGSVLLVLSPLPLVNLEPI